MKYIIYNKKFTHFRQKNYKFNNRLIILFSIIIFSIAITLFKITILQLFKAKQLTQEGDTRSFRTQLEPNSRGIIRDRSGNLLALSIPANTICIDPKLFFLKKK
ncbi:MAG: hypothetical protein UAT33_01035 [Buchnera aphidicola (Floraphis choui)]